MNKNIFILVKAELLRHARAVLAALLHMASILFAGALCASPAWAGPAVEVLSPVTETVYAINGVGGTYNVGFDVRAYVPDFATQVSKVEVFNGSTLIGTLTAPSVGSRYDGRWWITWPVISSVLGPTTYTLTAKVTDDASNVVTSSPVSLTIVADKPPNTVWVTADNPIAIPGSGPATINVPVYATDPDSQIALIELYVNSTLVGSLSPSPQVNAGTFSVPWPNVTPGSYYLIAKVTDNFGVSASSPNASYQVVANAPTSIAITSPTPNQAYWIAGNKQVPISVAASDPDSPISQVKISVTATGGSPFVTTLTTPSSGTSSNGVWSTSVNLSAGTYTVSATATDSYGQVTSTGSTTFALNQARSPSADFSNYQSQTFSGVVAFATSGGTVPVPIRMAVSAPDAPVSQLKPVGLPYGAVFSAPQLVSGTASAGVWQVLWTNPTTGSWKITAQVTDEAGQVRESSVYNQPGYVYLNVSDGTPPSVTITGPSAGSSVTGYWNGQTADITVTAHALGTSATIYNAQLKENDVSLGYMNIQSGSYSDGTWGRAIALTPGSHTITVTVTDYVGVMTTSQPITFTVVQPTPPAVSLLASPTIAEAPASIALSTNVSDESGVYSVLFMSNASSVVASGTLTSGTNKNGTWTANWTNVPAGSYSVTATAASQSGLSGTSTPVSVTVAQPGAPTISIARLGTAPLMAPAKVTFTANATATLAGATVSQVQFFSGTTPIGNAVLSAGTASTGTYSFDWGNVLAGAYTITAVVTDSNGQTKTSDPLSITVQNNPNPTVSVTRPVNGATYNTPATIILSADAADSNGGVTQVQFYSSDTLIGTAVMTTGSSTSGAYVYAWSGLVEGDYSVTARAINAAGRMTISDPALLKVRASSEVAVNITSPASDGIVPALNANRPLRLLANVITPSGATITGVQFLDGAKILGNGTLVSGTDGTASYAFEWNSGSPGAHNIVAQATDSKGNVTSSAVRTMTVNASSVISIIAPANGTTYVGPVGNIWLEGIASGPSGPFSGRIDVYLNGVYFDQIGAWGAPGHYAHGGWSNIKPGTYTITFVATDSVGTVTTSDPVTITINSSTAPTTAVTMPAPSSTFTSNTTIELRATAADGDGAISSVRFYANGRWLVETENAEHIGGGVYRRFWNNVPAGTYDITSVAVDDKGVFTVSAPISITVAANVPPTVTMLSPANGSSYPPNSSLPLSASATDSDGTVIRVRFYANGAWLENDSTQRDGNGNFSAPWGWWPPLPGTYSVTAVAIDNSGGTTISAPVTITVTGTSTNQAPTVSLTVPAGGSTYTAPAYISVGATASDSDGNVSRVDYYLNGHYMNVGTGDTNGFPGTIGNVPAGTYSLTAIARDNSGATTVSAPVSITVNPNGAPTISLAATGTNYVAPATINFSLNQVDPEGGGINSELYMDGQAVEYSGWNSKWLYNVPPGTHTFYAVAHDNAGMTGVSNTVTLNVAANQPPVISWKSPANGATFTQPAGITLAAFASDPDNGILGNRVRFYVEGKLLVDSYDQRADGSFDKQWYPAPGTYTVVAEVTDNAGLTARTPPITITMLGSNPPTVRWKAPLDGQVIPITAIPRLQVFADDAYTTTGANLRNIPSFINGVPYRDLAYWGRTGDGSYGENWYDPTPGTYTLTATVIDNAGLTASASITITVTAAPAPTVSITSPANGASVTTGNIALTAAAAIPSNAASGTTIAAVRFFSGETLIGQGALSSGTNTSGTYAITWNSVPVGSYTLTAEVTDSKGIVVSSTPVNITVVESSATTVSLTSPQPAAIYTAPATIPLGAFVSSGATVINQVQFYNGSTLVATGSLNSGNANSGTWTSNAWTNVAAGSYVLTAKATDANSNVISSSAVAITVNPASAGTGQMYFVSADHLGTPRLVQNQSQQAVWVWENQEPFGDSMPNENPSSLGVVEFNQRFRGQYFDGEVGRSYNLHRNYVSSIGRYAEADIVGLRGGINLYLYANANPLALIDPTGLSPVGSIPPNPAAPAQFTNVRGGPVGPTDWERDYNDDDDSCVLRNICRLWYMAQGKGGDDGAHNQGTIERGQRRNLPNKAYDLCLRNAEHYFYGRIHPGALGVGVFIYSAVKAGPVTDEWNDRGGRPTWNEQKWGNKGALDKLNGRDPPCMCGKND